MAGIDIQKLLQSGAWLIENRQKLTCECGYIESCQPRAYFEQFGEWSMDYTCPYESLEGTDKKSACRRSKVCRCRRYYMENNKECPPMGHPYEDGDTSVDRCRCVHYKSCEYRAFFDTFAQAPDAYACEISYGVELDIDKVDRLIESSSDNWAVYRMPAVDRNILRIAAWEMLRESEEVPISVAINEAVTIAKEYGGEDSSKFINGVLGKIALDFERRIADKEI